ncbi:MAG: sigma-70 family RNA polymerase sigma factor [Planctomycetota bacterium]
MTVPSSSASNDDRELVSRCLHHDADAWEALVRRYQRLIYSVLLSLQVSPTDCADVFQCVCLALLKNLGVLRDVPRLSSWLVTTAHREALHTLRRPQYESLESTERGAAAGADDAGAIAAPADRVLKDARGTLYHRPEPLPEAMLCAIEEQALIRQAIGSLPERCRALLTVLYYDRTRPTYEEIEARLSIPVGAIGPTRSRCLEKLRLKLTQLGFP